MKRSIKSRLEYILLTAAALLTVISGCFGSGKTGDPNIMIHTDGTVLLDGNGNRIRLKGISFGNQVWQNPATPPANHHTEDSYRELSGLGFNTIRFYMNYGIFEDDSAPYIYKESGFEWLDRNIEWAKKYNMMLILNMHVPQGGFQSLGEGLELWNNEDNRKRFTALWKEIAGRYSGEQTIAAYDLLNEPVTSENIGQWESLAADTVSAIREVDSSHMLIVERLLGCAGDWSGNLNGRYNFITVDDGNYMVEFHFYEPMDFTHQGASWVPSLTGADTVYPDETKVEITGTSEWAGATFDNPALGTAAGWQYLEGKIQTIDLTKTDFLKPTVQVKMTGSGSVICDEIRIDRLVNGSVDKSWSLGADDAENWYFWSEDGSGSMVTDTNGYSGSALKVSGTVSDAVISYEKLKILPEEGFTYRISGWLKGEGLTASSAVTFRLDFYAVDGTVSYRNRTFIENEMKRFSDITSKFKVPAYLGEFGAISQTFENNRGGTLWVRDVIESAETYGIHFNYHDYHEGAFGLYRNSPDDLPADRNEELYLLFGEILRN